MAIGQGQTCPRCSRVNPVLTRRSRSGSPDFVFAFHDSDEIGPKMLARIAKHTGLTPDNL
jgi:hypothetical protein